MKYQKVILFFIYFLSIIININVYGQSIKEHVMKYNPLTEAEERVILRKGTEAPFVGEYTENKAKGTYVCKQCNAPLYQSDDKFNSRCGWPSFDDEIKGAILKVPDADGRRTEIVCANCKGHLGHVFTGENFTPKQTRHCVNSISMAFVPEGELLSPTIKLEPQTEKAYFASGCFWGTEYYFSKLKGVVETAVGFMGGYVENPTYQQVCGKNTGHLETVEVIYNPEQVTYDELVKFFFETHDFTQTDGQGPDIGPQYLSAIFYKDRDEKNIAEENIKTLQSKGYTVATKLKPISHFWKAEDYHQQYYDHKGTTPYCHFYRKIF